MTTHQSSNAHGTWQELVCTVDFVLRGAVRITRTASCGCVVLRFVALRRSTFITYFLFISNFNLFKASAARKQNSGAVTMPGWVLWTENLFAVIE